MMITGIGYRAEWWWLVWI